MKKHTISRRSVIKGLGATGVAAFAGCQDDSGGDGGGGGETDAGGDMGGDETGTTVDTTDGGDGGSDSVSAAFVFNSEVGDLGWSWAHNDGREAIEEEYDWLDTEYSEAVAPSDSEQVFSQYANEGYDIVFGNTFEYMDPMYNVAEQNTDVLFEHCSGYRARENMGRYFGRIYQARYLTGIAAGMVTEADSLGYVAAFPIPEVVRGINAFALGAGSVNEDVSTQVRWTNTWFDPPTEQEAAQSLIDQGVDVMAQHQDSPAAVRAASDADIWATGYNAPMEEFAQENFLTSPIWHWEEFYGPTVESVRDGSWESDAYWEGLNAGIVDVDDWGPEVPSDVQDTVEEERSAIESGDLDVWAGTPFEGEDDEFLFQEMSSFVEYVDGEVPSE